MEETIGKMSRICLPSGKVYGLVSALYSIRCRYRKHLYPSPLALGLPAFVIDRERYNHSVERAVTGETTFCSFISAKIDRELASARSFCSQTTRSQAQKASDQTTYLRHSPPAQIVPSRTASGAPTTAGSSSSSGHSSAGSKPGGRRDGRGVSTSSVAGFASLRSAQKRPGRRRR